MTINRSFLQKNHIFKEIFIEQGNYVNTNKTFTDESVQVVKLSKQYNIVHVVRSRAFKKVKDHNIMSSVILERLQLLALLYANVFRIPLVWLRIP